MSAIRYFLFILIAHLALTSFSSCNSSENFKDSDKIKDEQMTSNPLKAGGLYLLKNKDSLFYVSKILVLDDDAVHLRTYSNKFTAPPTEVASEDLSVLIGHSPLAKEGFLDNNPKLISVEKVKDDELEGYKLYLERMYD